MATRERKKSAPSEQPASAQAVVKVAGKDLQLHEMTLDSLNAAEYNPRKLSFKEERELKNSLDRFGFVDPIIVNQHPERLNVLVGGHKRVEALKALGYTSVMAIHVNLDPKQEKELNLRLNRGGTWDFDKMAQFFSPDELDFVGFTMDEIKTAFPTFGQEKPTKGKTVKAGDTGTPTSIPLSPQVDKTADYIFVQVRDVEQMESLQALLGLEKVQDATKRHKGIQHIISGNQLVAALQKGAE